MCPQFVLFIAANCVLHRPTSQVIHRSECILNLWIDQFSCVKNRHTHAKLRSTQQKYYLIYVCINFFVGSIQAMLIKSHRHTQMCVYQNKTHAQARIHKTSLCMQSMLHLIYTHTHTHTCTCMTMYSLYISSLMTVQALTIVYSIDTNMGTVIGFL